MVVGLSHKVKNFDKLNIQIKASEEAIAFTAEPNGSKNISSSWKLKFSTDKSEIEISI